MSYKKNTNFQTYKLTKLTSGLCPLRSADLPVSELPGQRASMLWKCFQGFPLCQRHDPTEEDLLFVGMMAIRGEASHKPSPPQTAKGFDPLALAQRVFLVLVIKNNNQRFCRIRRLFLFPRNLRDQRGEYRVFWHADYAEYADCFVSAESAISVWIIAKAPVPITYGASFL